MKYILSYYYEDDDGGIITTIVGNEFDILDKYREFEASGIGFSRIDDLVEFMNNVEPEEALISISQNVRFTLSTIDGTPLVIW